MEVEFTDSTRSLNSLPEHKSGACTLATNTQHIQETLGAMMILAVLVPTVTIEVLLLMLNNWQQQLRQLSFPCWTRTRKQYSLCGQDSYSLLTYMLFLSSQIIIATFQGKKELLAQACLNIFYWIVSCLGNTNLH